MKTCCWCGKPIKGLAYNFIMGTYSHVDCDNNHFKEQEKRVKYLK